MAIPIQIRNFPPYLGDSQGVGIRLLSTAFSPRGTINVRVNELGKLTKTGGYRQIGPAAGSGGDGWRQFRFYRPGSGTNVFLIGGTDATIGGLVNGLHYATLTSVSGPLDIAWNPIGGSGGYGGVGDMAQMGADLIVTAPNLPPGYLSGSPPIFGLVAYTQLAGPAVALGAGGVLTGNHAWKILPTVLGVPKWASAYSGVTATLNQTGLLTWVADPDVSVSGYDIYRTTGTGETYFYVSSVVGRLTVAYADTIPDSTIVGNRTLIEHGDDPPASWFCEVHKGRMWYGNTGTFAGPVQDGARTVYYSDPDDFRSVYRLTNKFEITNEATFGDQIVGMTGDFRGMIVIWFTRSIFTISGSGQILGLTNDWNLDRTTAVVGTVHHRTVVEVPIGAKYTDELGALQTTSEPTLAYLTPLKDIRLFDGESDTVISNPMKDRLLAYTPPLTGLDVYSHVVHDKVRKQIIWYLGIGGAITFATHGFAWNYSTGTWQEYDEQYFGAACFVPSSVSGEQNILIAGGINGIGNPLGAVCRLYDDATRMGVPFASQVRFAPLYFGADPITEPDTTFVKRYHYLDLLFETMAVPVDMQVRVHTAIVGLEEDAPASPFVAVTVLTSKAVRADLARSGFGDIRDGRFPHSRGLTVVLRDEDLTVPGLWVLEAMAIGYQLLPGDSRAR